MMLPLLVPPLAVAVIFDIDTVPSTTSSVHTPALMLSPVLLMVR